MLPHPIKFITIITLLGLTGCAADGTTTTIKPSCQSYEQQVTQCREHNSRYKDKAGMFNEKVVACLQGRGFYQRKSYYCQ
ncbi:MAG: hypothetical protein Q4E77_05820 [Conchiformibius sp.]|nr:hypothetical protein [Conchiformibius sp.]